MNRPKIFQAVDFLNHWPQWFFRILRIGLLSLGVVAVLIVMTELLMPGIVSKQQLNFFEFLAWLCLPLCTTVVFFEIFIASYLKCPPLRQGMPVEEFLDFDSARLISRSLGAGSSHLSEPSLIRTMLADKKCRAMWLRLNIDPKSWLESFGRVQAEKLGTEDDLVSFWESLVKIVREHRTDRIMFDDLLVALFESNAAFQFLMLQNNITREDISSLGIFLESQQEHIDASKKFWSLRNRLRQRPIGINWIYGYTPLLSRYSRDLNSLLENQQKEIFLVGRQDVLEQLERILSRAGANNTLFLGKPGIGKRTIIMDLVQLMERGRVHPGLAYKRILELDLGAVLATARSNQEIEALLIKLLHDAVRAGNLILYIDKFDNFVGSGGVGKVDISEVLKPYLGDGGIQLIAASEPSYYHRLIEPRQDLMKYFEKIEIDEPDAAQTLEILQTNLPELESRQNVLVTQSALRNVVEKADAFIPDKAMPQKAIDLLIEVVAADLTSGKQLIQPEDVDAIIAQKTHVPVGKITASEKDTILHLKETMHHDIVDQETAIEQLSQAVLRLRAGVTSSKKPAGSFLFAGPTGVGKTLTAKILAKVYFGGEERMVRFDMSEFQALDSLDRFLGSQSTSEPSQFLSKVKDNPFSVILLDELEKAHPKILNLLLQVLDEAHLTDAFGNKTSFKQNIIIATSNAGAEFIREMVGNQTDPASEKELFLDYLLKNQLFTPELINRFDGIIVFHPLSQEHVIAVAHMLLRDLSERLKLQNYFLSVSDDLANYIARVGYDPQFGARPMQRAIQNTIEVVIAQKIINGQIQKGQEFTIDLAELPA